VSQAANEAASRSGSRSTGRWLPMSISTVPYMRPFLNANSSTPSTVGAASHTLSGIARINRSSVIRAAGRPSAAARCAPARPANASPTRVNASRACTVNRAYGVVSPSTCSANVLAGQADRSQRNRRTVSRNSTRRPPDEQSTRRR
jgi:hypothetical protein